MRLSVLSLPVSLAAVLAAGCGDRVLMNGTGENTGVAGASGVSGGAGVVGSPHPDPTPADAAAPAGAAGATAPTPGAAGGDGGAPTPPDAPITLPSPTAVQVVTRLAAVLWNELPGPDLLQAAPKDTSGLAPLVRQMLADPRAANGVAAFYRWWLDLPSVAASVRDPALFPTFTPELAADMAKETETFGVNVTLGLNGTFTTLMTANYSFINARLADVYGVADVRGDTLQQVYLPTGQRAGLLTQPALQVLGAYANRTSPAHRGSDVDQRFFCVAVPAAPPGVHPLDPIPFGTTVRQQEELSTASLTVCQVCHKAIDPIGFAFEGFDAAGRARTTDNGAPVDVSGLDIYVPRLSSELLSSDPALIEGPISGPVELAMLMAAAPSAQDCLARKWLSFALGRDVQDSDGPAIARIDETFTASNLNLKELIVAVLTSPPFLAP